MGISASAPASAAAAAKGNVGYSSKPAPPTGVYEYFVPNNLSLAKTKAEQSRAIPETAKDLGLVYQPALLSKAVVRYSQSKYNLDYEQQITSLVFDPDTRSLIQWDNFWADKFDEREFDPALIDNARYVTLVSPFNDSRAHP